MERNCRQPWTAPPLPCYGLGYSSTDAVCSKCVFAEGCTKICEDRVPLSKAVFDLTPDKVRGTGICTEIDGKNVRRTDVENIYRRCHYAVFGQEWPSRSGLTQEWSQIVYNAQLSNLTLDAFIGTVMLAHKLMQPHVNFYSTILTAKNSVQQIEKYTQLCKEKCGYTGLEALGICLREEVDSLDDNMLHSEIVAGSYVLHFKLKIGGLPYESLYELKELTLDPYWLATEPTYIETVLEPYSTLHRKGTPMQDQHRHLALNAHAALKRKKTLARTVFETRSRIMPLAVVQVLRPLGYPVDAFTVPNISITESMFLWTKLAAAILHIECTKAVHSAPHVLWR